jgi:hypothetical protein
VLVGAVDAAGLLVEDNCEVDILKSGLRMRQEDDADEVEKACYESHCVYAILRLPSGVVGKVHTVELCSTFSDAGLKVGRSASARA